MSNSMMDLLEGRSKAKFLPIGMNQGISYNGMDTQKSETYSVVSFSSSAGRINKFLFYPHPTKGVYPQTFNDKDGNPVTESVREAFERVFKERVNWFPDLVIALEAQDLVANINSDGIKEFDETAFSAWASAINDALKPLEGSETQLVNLKVIYDSKGQYPEIPNKGFIEKHVPGLPCGLKMTNYETKNRLTPKVLKTAAAVITETDSNLPPVF